MTKTIKRIESINGCYYLAVGDGLKHLSISDKEYVMNLTIKHSKISFTGLLFIRDNLIKHNPSIRLDEHIYKIGNSTYYFKEITCFNDTVIAVMYEIYNQQGAN